MSSTALDMNGGGAAAGPAERSLRCRLADLNLPTPHIHDPTLNKRLYILPSTSGLRPILFPMRGQGRFVFAEYFPVFVTVVPLVRVGRRRQT